MHFDICCCTYRSSKWLKGFFEALQKVDYDKAQLHLYFTDNCSVDDTVEQLRFFQKKLNGVFGDFQIISAKENAGFGTASNCSAKAGHSPYILFYNVDTAICSDAFSQLEKAILQADENTAVFELRQLPFEHPKFYDPVTLKTSWTSGAAFVMTRKAFELTGGFDESIFMYCEDVDLSWRVRLAGYDIQYVPKAVTYHFTADDITQMKTSQIAGQLAGEKVLRLKFGNAQQLKQWEEYRQLFQPYLDADPTAAQLAEKLLKQVETHRRIYRNFYKQRVQNSGFLPCFEMGYDFCRAGVSALQLPTCQTRITVILPYQSAHSDLEQRLECLKNQTYTNFEVIVAQQKGGDAQELLEKYADAFCVRGMVVDEAANFCDLVNAALDTVSTEYVCVLAQGSLFFADFLEQNASMIQENPQAKMFFSASVASSVSALQDLCAVKQYRNIELSNWNKVSLFAENRIPVQAVVFATSLFPQLGGFDKQLKEFAVWECWMRYAMEAEPVITDRALSIFFANEEAFPQPFRQYEQSDAWLKMRNKMQNMLPACSADEIADFLWSKQNKQWKEQQELECLRKSAQEIRKSNIWRCVNGMRRIAAAVKELSDKMWGPAFGVRQGSEYADIQRFVSGTKSSFYMRIFREFVGKK